MRALLTCVTGALLVALPAGAAAFPGETVTLSADDGADYRAPALALTGAGDAVAAWVRAPAGDRAGSGRVVVAQRSRRGRWSPGRTLSRPAAGAPAAAINARGQAAVAWGERTRLHVATRSGRSAGWRTAVAATTMRGGAVRDVAVSVDRRGTITVMWSETATGGFRVRMAARPAGRARWTVRRSRLAVGGRPALLVSPGRGGIAMWTAEGSLWAAHDTGDGFEPAVRLAGRDPDSPALAYSRAGRTLAAWGTRLPGGTIVLAAAERLSAARRWRDLGDLGVGSAPMVGGNARGDAIIAWASADDAGRAGIEAVTRRAGGGWVPTTIRPRGACDCEYELGGAVVDGTGDAAVSWRRRDETGDGAAAIATRPRSGSRWRIRRVGPVPDYGPPSLAASAGRTAGAVWASSGDDGGVRTRIRSGAGSDRVAVRRAAGRSAAGR